MSEAQFTQDESVLPNQLDEDYTVFGNDDSVQQSPQAEFESYTQPEQHGQYQIQSSEQPLQQLEQMIPEQRSDHDLM